MTSDSLINLEYNAIEIIQRKLHKSLTYITYMQPCYLARVKENEISTIENPTHTMPIDCMPETVVAIWLVQFTMHQFLYLYQWKMFVIKFA